MDITTALQHINTLLAIKQSEVASLITARGILADTVSVTTESLEEKYRDAMNSKDAMLSTSDARAESERKRADDALALVSEQTGIIHNMAEEIADLKAPKEAEASEPLSI